MQTNNIINLIGIKEIIVKNVENLENTITIESEIRKKTKRCLLCNSKKIQIHDHRKQNIRDIPFFNKSIIIRLDIKRYKCRNCNKTFSDQKSFVSKKCQLTNRLKFEILKEFRNKISMKYIAKKYMVSLKTVINIVNKIDVVRLKLSEVINIDEFKGNSGKEKYQTVISDSVNKKIIDILPSRKYEKLDKYFSKISKEEKENVKIFVSDMSRTFKSIKKKHFPKAIHVVDRYHFVRQVIWSFENTRKEQRKQMKQSEKINFMRSRSLLTKPQIKLNNQEKLKVAIMLERNEEIRKAYLTKESFYTLVMRSENKEKAKDNIRNWVKYLLAKNTNKWKACKTAFTNWLEEISNSFEYNFTNAFVEGCNNKIKVLKRISFGMRNFKRFRNRILLMQ